MPVSFMLTNENPLSRAGIFRPCLFLLNHVLVKRSIPFLFFLCFSYGSIAQNLFVAGKSTIQPTFLLQESYVMIKLPENKIGDERCNFLNLSNPFTNIVLLNDEKGLSYHIMYQANFEGKLLYLACSRNLMTLLEKNGRLTLGMDRCIQRANQQMMSLAVVDEMVRCFLERVNH